MLSPLCFKCLKYLSIPIAAVTVLQALLTSLSLTLQMFEKHFLSMRTAKCQSWDSAWDSVLETMCLYLPAHLD